MKRLKIILCLLFVGGMVGSGLPFAFSQEEELAETIQVTGEIAKVDLEKSIVVIKQLKDEDNEIYEDVDICVDGATVIEKDYETVGLDELAAGEDATVEYTANEEGKNVATYIFVNTEEE